MTRRWGRRPPTAVVHPGGFYGTDVGRRPGAVVVRRGLGGRLTWTALTGMLASGFPQWLAGRSASGGTRLLLVGAVLAGGAGLAALIGALWRWRPLVDESGWRFDGEVVSWDEVERVVLFWGWRRSSFLAGVDGRRHRLVLPHDSRASTRIVWASEEAALCAAHDLAHELGLPPVSVVVHLTDGVAASSGDPPPLVPFAMSCTRCGSAPLG